MNPFATLIDLESYWRDLTSDEEARATIMLNLASNKLRLLAEDLNIDLDAKVEASAAYSSVIGSVVMDATRRAMSTPTDQPAVDSSTITAGPYSENFKYSNPTGDLWFKKSELNSIGLYGAQKLTSIRSSQSDIYADCSS